MEIREYDENKLQVAWEIQRIGDWQSTLKDFDDFAKIAPFALNKTKCFPTVHAYGRKGYKAYCIIDKFDGMNLREYLTSHCEDEKQFYQVYTTVAYTAPSLIQQTLRELFPNKFAVLPMNIPFYFITKEGRIFCLDFEFAMPVTNLSAALRRDSNLFANLYEFVVLSKKFSFNNRNLKEKQEEGIDEKINRIEELEIRNSLLESKLKNSIRKEVVRTNIGEAHYQLLFGDDSE